MKFDELINALSPERAEVLRRAVELGKWPDGRMLGRDERETSLQVLIAYDIKHKPQEERIGYIPKETPTECEQDHNHDHSPDVIAKG